ncbi:AAA family ATPase [Luteibacter sp. dw_328]|uniref:AAA family ATPase n=1 Tax=Luteibacter sp. dw_328 TaxID=2719796 RepID=UPI001BD32E21
MPNIKVKSIEFGDIGFRKLKDFSVDIASRITLVSGHNGIGKSTILGLLANSSGLTQLTKAPKSYFGKTFQANLSEIIFIDYEGEFLSAQEADALPRPIITYEINGQESFQKRCALTDRSTEGRARIVPRNFYPSSKKFVSADDTITIGDASKVPLPTLYLGMTRVFPLGEAEEGSGYSEVLKTMPDADRQLIADFMNAVIVGTDAKQASVTSNRIKGTSKFSSHPQYGYDARCVSLGQDSLGSIAAAIASFQMLKRDWVDYPGGLLVIDELDSGFHPHAIKRLVEQLAKAAEDLNLQIVATTHSTKLIEAIYPRANSRSAKNVVAYLMDTRAPRLMSSGTLQSILDDMDLIPPGLETVSKRPVLRTYLEDKEAETIFNLLIPAARKRALGAAYDVAIKPIAMGVGCDSLANLTSIDSHFKLALFALDADANIRAKHLKYQNIVKLPGAAKASPERTLFAFIQDLISNRDAHPETWRILTEKNITTDQINAHLLDWKDDLSKRSHAKKWWKDRANVIKSWKLFEAWMAENQAMVEQFHKDFEAAVKVVAKRLRTLAKMPVNP